MVFIVYYNNRYLLSSMLSSGCGPVKNCASVYSGVSSANGSLLQNMTSLPSLHHRPAPRHSSLTFSPCPLPYHCLTFPPHHCYTSPHYSLDLKKNSPSWLPHCAKRLLFLHCYQTMSRELLPFHQIGNNILK